LNPTATLTFADLNIGIPALIICLQNVPLAFFFHFAYPYKPYILTPESNGRYRGGFCGWRGWVSIFNPMEVVRGVLFTFEMASLQGNEDGTIPDEAYVPLSNLPNGERY
jgi:hypothetical protein